MRQTGGDAAGDDAQSGAVVKGSVRAGLCIVELAAVIGDAAVERGARADAPRLDPLAVVVEERAAILWRAVVSLVEILCAGRRERRVAASYAVCGGLAALRGEIYVTPLTPYIPATVAGGAGW